MGPHKKSPPPNKGEPVTALFKKQVVAALAVNDEHNTRLGLDRGDPGRLISTHGELADAIGCDPNLIKNMFGGVHPGTKTKKIGRSKYVPLIRDALGISALISVEIQDITPAHAALIKLLGAMPYEKLKKFVDDLRELDRNR
jgi:hypothetical protein